MQDSIIIRLAQLEDLSLYLRWVNEPIVRKNSIDSDQVSLSIHEKWFSNKLNSKNSILLVMELDELPIGQIRFDIENEIALIDYSIDQEFRKKGFGDILIKKGIEYLLKTPKTNNISVFRGVVKTFNTPSIRVFIKNGFEENKSYNSKEEKIFEITLPSKNSHK